MASNQYHLHIESLTRSKGRSSVQYAAYVSGSVLKDKRLGVRHDHTTKEEVRNSMIYLPDSAPESLKEELKACGDDKKKLNRFREKIWNSIEMYETHKNAVVGKALDIAYPYELTLEQRKACRDKVVKLFTSLGYVVDISDHDVKNNPHMQALIGVRPMVNNDECFWSETKEIKGFVCESKKTGQTKTFRKVKDIEEYNNKYNEDFRRIPVIDKKTGKQKLARRNELVWKKTTMKYNPINDKENLYKWRQDWENIANTYLDDENKISCKSYKARGINKIPKRHIRAGAYKMGDKSDRVKLNKLIDKANEELKKNDDQLFDVELELEGTEEYYNNEYQNFDPETFVDNIRNEQHQQHLNLVNELTGAKKDIKHRDTHVPRIAGLNARQREIEDEIEKFLKSGNDEKGEKENDNG